VSESRFDLLELIKQQTQAARTANAVLAKAEQETSTKAVETIKTMATRAEDIGAAQQIVVGAKQYGELKAQEIASAAVDTAGGYDALFQNIAAIAERQASLRQNLDTVRQVQSEITGIGPIAGIRRVLASGDARRNAEVDLEQLQALSSGNQALMQNLGTVGNLARANAKTLTAAAAKASVDVVALQAQQEADRLALEGLKQGLNGVTAAAQASDRDLRLSTEERAFDLRERQFQFAVEQAAEARATAKFNRSIREEALETKREEAQVLETALQEINLGRNSRNLPPLTMVDLRGELKLGGGKLPQELAEMRQTGKMTAATGQAFIATSPADVGKVLASSPDLLASLNAQQKKAAELILEAQTVLGDPKNKIALSDDKTGAKARALVAGRVQDTVAGYLALPGNNTENPFFVGEPSSYIGSAAAPGISTFQDYTLTQKVFNPAIAAGSSLADPSVPYGLTLAAVKKGDIPLAQAAADFAAIYKRMSAVHRASVDFKKFAISLPADGATYRAKVNGQLVDLTNWEQVYSAMNKDLRRSEMADYRSGTRVNPGLAREMQRNLPKDFPNE
jgi:hypothetical protein